jgi:hypothetical protein
MNDLHADIILFDTVGSPYTGETVITNAMGGSEFQAILLLEEFAKLGKKVICLNNTKIEKSFNNVLYLPNTSIFKYNIKCNHLILHRNSIIPKIPHKYCYQWITDNNSSFNLSYYNYLNDKKIKLITLSQYSNEQFANDWDKHVINFMIPDWVYQYKIPENKQDFIYASSIMKGYHETINHWKFLKQNNKFKNKILNVCLPGYDNPENDISESDFNIKYHGSLTFKQVIDLMASCKGLFYVNCMTETFCLTAVLAEILQTTPYIYCMNGYGALKEVLNSDTIVKNSKDFFEHLNSGNPIKTNPKNYQVKKIMNEWIKVMNLT